MSTGERIGVRQGARTHLAAGLYPRQLQITRMAKPNMGCRFELTEDALGFEEDHGHCHRLIEFWTGDYTVILLRVL